MARRNRVTRKLWLFQWFLNLKAFFVWKDKRWGTDNTQYSDTAGLTKTHLRHLKKKKKKWNPCLINIDSTLFPAFFLYIAINIVPWTWYQAVIVLWDSDIVTPPIARQKKNLIRWSIRQSFDKPLTVVMRTPNAKVQWVTLGNSCEWVCCGLQHAPSLNSREKNGTHTLVLIENTCTWLIQGIRTSSKMTSVETPGGWGVWAEFSLTKQTLSQWKLWRIRESEKRKKRLKKKIRVCLFVFLLKDQFFLGWQETLVLSEWIHLSVCECMYVRACVRVLCVFL